MQNKSGYTLGTYCAYPFPPLFAVGITDLCFSQPQELLNVFLISALIKLRISRTVFYLFSCFLISPLLPDMTPCLMPGKMFHVIISHFHLFMQAFDLYPSFFTCGKVALYPCIRLSTFFLNYTTIYRCENNTMPNAFDDATKSPARISIILIKKYSSTLSSTLLCLINISILYRIPFSFPHCLSWPPHLKPFIH